MTTIRSDIREAARRLAEANADSEPALEAIYLFPAPDEIRLIELDPTALPSEQITPYYFRADPEGQLPFASAIALIRPEEKHRLSPPAHWGRWKDAERIWQRDAADHG